jgi:hypothetical protein
MRERDLKDGWRWSSQKAVVVNSKHKYLSSYKIRQSSKTITNFKYGNNNSQTLCLLINLFGFFTKPAIDISYYLTCNLPSIFS